MFFFAICVAIALVVNDYVREQRASRRNCFSIYVDASHA